MRRRDIVGRLGEADNVENPSALPAVSGQDKGRVIGSWVYSLPLDLPRPDDDDLSRGPSEPQLMSLPEKTFLFPRAPVINDRPRARRTRHRC